MTPVQLPEVPAPVSGTNALIGGYTVWVAPASNYYTAAQLREYATDAVMADRVTFVRDVMKIVNRRVTAGRHADKIWADLCETFLTPSETNSER